MLWLGAVPVVIVIAVVTQENVVSTLKLHGICRWSVTAITAPEISRLDTIV
jgi:hypothetical protein